MKNKLWIVIPDLQIPYHCPTFVADLLRVVRKIKPTGLLCVGDEIDFPQVSRWSKGWAEEYATTFWDDILQTRKVMAQFRDALGPRKPFHVMRSNHGERVQSYIRRYAPAVRDVPSLRYQSLLEYDRIGVTYHELPYRFAPGWALAHGDEGGLRKHAGWTAMGLCEKWGVSVACGHTHRAGLLPVSRGFGGKVSTVWAFEVGHGMDLSKAHYMPALSANWQQAAGMIRVRGRQVTPTLLPYDKGFLLP